MIPINNNQSYQNTISPVETDKGYSEYHNRKKLVHIFIFYQCLVLVVSIDFFPAFVRRIFISTMNVSADRETELPFSGDKLSGDIALNRP